MTSEPSDLVSHWVSLKMLQERLGNLAKCLHRMHKALGSILSNKSHKSILKVKEEKSEIQGHPGHIVNLRPAWSQKLTNK